MIKQYRTFLLEESRFWRELLSDSDLYLLAALLVVIIYLLVHRKRIEERSIIIGAALVALSTIAIPPGIAIILLSFDKATCQLTKVEPKAIFVGGLILTLVGLQGLVKNFQQ
jgi:hypothetical protein